MLMHTQASFRTLMHTWMSSHTLQHIYACSHTPGHTLAHLGMVTCAHVCLGKLAHLQACSCTLEHAPACQSTLVHSYACMYPFGCIHVCLDVLTHTRVPISTHACLGVLTHAHHAWAHLHIPGHSCTLLHAQACLNMLMYDGASLCQQRHTHTHLGTLTRAHSDTLAGIRAHLCMLTHTR